MLPQAIISNGTEMERVGINAVSIHWYFFSMVSGLLQSTSVSISSINIKSGRAASLRVPRGDCPAPTALKEAPFRVVKSPSSQPLNDFCSP
ncbi:hypothetical protein D3C72_2028370 [compost metagenome]